jgi:hypothetical protein
MEKQLSDAELVETGKRVAYKISCKSILVATGIPPVRPEGRNYFQCDRSPQSHDIHRNQHDEWWIDNDGNWQFKGDSLKDPTFAGANA